MLAILKGLNKGFLFIDLILFLALLGFAYKITININNNFKQHALVATAKEIILFLQSLREESITSGQTLIVEIDTTSSSFRVKSKINKYLKIPSYLNIRSVHKITFANQEIKFFPDGHVSAGSLYLILSVNKMLKLTISVHQIPIFTLYKYVNNGWQKIFY